MSPEAAGDISHFLDSVPVHAGNKALIAAGIVWAAVVGLGLFTMMQSKELTEIRAELQTSEAIKPSVPQIALQPVASDELKRVVEFLKKTYPSLNISENGGVLRIQSKQTADFAVFREAIGHAVNGGKDWKISIDSLCVGRECKDSGLSAALKIQKLSIDKPSS